MDTITDYRERISRIVLVRLNRIQYRHAKVYCTFSKYLNKAKKSTAEDFVRINGIDITEIATMEICITNK